MANYFRDINGKIRPGGEGGGEGHNRYHLIQSNEDHNVAITNLQNNHILIYNSTTGKWQNVAITNYTHNRLHNIESNADHNVDISNLQNNHILIYDASTGKWKNALITNFTHNRLHNIESSADHNVYISNLGDNHILVYDTSLGRWKNALIADYIHNRLHRIESDEDHNVDIRNLDDKDILFFDAKTGKWRNTKIETLALPPGVVILVYADEEKSSGVGPATMKVAYFSNFMYNKVIAESEGYVRLTVGNNANAFEAEIMIAISDISSPILKIGTDLDIQEVLSFANTLNIPFSIKFSIPELKENNFSVAVKIYSENSDFDWFCNSLRVYGVS